MNKLRMNELRKLSNKEVDDRLVELKKELVELNFNAREIKNAGKEIHLFSAVKKEIAKLLTVKNEPRTVEDGVKK
jgi:ribosomal protein L29